MRKKHSRLRVEFCRHIRLPTKIPVSVVVVLERVCPMLAEASSNYLVADHGHAAYARPFEVGHLCHVSRVGEIANLPGGQNNPNGIHLVSIILLYELLRLFVGVFARTLGNVLPYSENAPRTLPQSVAMIRIELLTLS